jgi:hypothetical protein
MKMKVSELEGATLDYWVAKAEGATRAHIATDEKGDFAVAEFTIDSGTKFTSPYFPSTQWGDGGPIFEREGFGICKFYEPTDGPCPEGSEWCALWRDDSMRADGPTPLIAGMRLYVMSKFGEEVSEE